MRLVLLINFHKILLQSPVFTAIETNKVLKYWRKIKWKNPFQPLTIWPQLEQPQWSYISILSTRAHIALPIVCPILQGGEFLWENLQNRETLVNFPNPLAPGSGHPDTCQLGNPTKITLTITTSAALSVLRALVVGSAGEALSGKIALLLSCGPALLVTTTWSEVDDQVKKFGCIICRSGCP